MNNLIGLIGACCLIAFLHAVPANAENTVTIDGRSLLLGPSGTSGTSLMTGAVGSFPAIMPDLAAPSTFFREVPSISGQYSFGGRPVLPYLGAGFGNGYTSDLDRSLNHPRSTAVDSGFRTQLGQGLAPNEFQMGIRIPF